MKELYKKFKSLTGIRYADIAAELGISRQAVDQSFDNYSITHINANKWIITTKIEQAIEQHEEAINKLKELKTEVNEYRRDSVGS